jgi:hypothetical protein
MPHNPVSIVSTIGIRARLNALEAKLVLRIQSQALRINMTEAVNLIIFFKSRVEEGRF